MAAAAAAVAVVLFRKVRVVLVEFIVRLPVVAVAVGGVVVGFVNVNGDRAVSIAVIAV